MIGNKKIIAITLARGGSKRIPKKNVALLCGKPLIQYTIDEVLKSKYIDRYVISSDDSEILELCKHQKVVLHSRSKENSSDVATSAAAIKEVCSVHPDYDFIVEVMCTNPLKTVEDIDACIEKIYNTKADSVVSVVRIFDHHPSRVKYIENDRLMAFYPEIPESRRQDLSPPAYVRNGSIYAMKWQNIALGGVRLGADTRPYIMPSDRSVNIDEPQDFLVAEHIIRKRSEE